MSTASRKLAGYEGEIIGPNEIKHYHPFLETFGVKAAFRTVTDGHVAPADITNAMAAGARKLGAEIYRRTRVTDIKLLPSGEWKVITDKGNIICRACGEFGRLLLRCGRLVDRPQCADRQHAASLHDHRAAAGADRSRRRNCRWCAIPIPMPICAKKPTAFWSAPTKPKRRMSAGTASRRPGISKAS